MRQVENILEHMNALGSSFGFASHRIPNGIEAKYTSKIKKNLTSFVNREESAKMDIESMTRYVSPVNPAIYPHLTTTLLSIGIFFTAWFFVYEVTSTKYTRDIYKELLVALVGAAFMGFGLLFLLLWVGIYV